MQRIKEVIDNKKKAKTAFYAKIVAGLVVFLILVFICTGFYVIQPIGALPEGITVWYFRVGLDLPFITSPDGYSLKKEGKVSLLNRLNSMAEIIEATKDRIILRLPYIKQFYFISTGGKTYSSK